MSQIINPRRPDPKKELLELIGQDKKLIEDVYSVDALRLPATPGLRATGKGLLSAYPK